MYIEMYDLSFRGELFRCGILPGKIIREPVRANKYNQFGQEDI